MPEPISNIVRLAPGLVEPIGGKIGITNPSEIVGDDKFSDLFANMLNSVNDLQHESADIQKAMMAGEPVELHQVMIKAEEAGLTMDLLLEIRNKLLNAYTEIIHMPM
ncbi:MAG: flagellar hook-basal body complex protein FliE [candidate division Zixibacteria bacterium]|nr:flagellar hook-basal body complex protein FliE [candidate division Zixibacteria bacterium]